jgi:hypothetical protein
MKLLLLDGAGGSRIETEMQAVPRVGDELFVARMDGDRGFYRVTAVQFAAYETGVRPESDHVAKLLIDRVDLPT